MDTERIARIQYLMVRFRNAAADPLTRARHSGFWNFPSSSCTWASFALGHLLAELEPDADWHLVNAEAGDGWGGHDWLESRGLAVDVTADQFEGYSPYVGSAPPPRPERYNRALKRIELAAWHRPHEEALDTIRKLM